LDSGFNLYIAETGTCDTLTCVLEETSTGSSCASNQAGANVSFQSQFGTTYYLELVSFSPDPEFDPTQAGTSGFLRVKT
jgi:hypothetical protein